MVLLMAATRGSTLVAWVAAEDNSMYLNVTCMHSLGKTMRVYMYIHIDLYCIIIFYC